MAETSSQLNPIPFATAAMFSVASSQSIDDAMRLTRPRGTLVLVGMPGIPSGIDWTSVWYKELRVQGAYAYGWEDDPLAPGVQTRSMILAMQMLEREPARFRPLMSGTFPLGDYRAALGQAFNAGRAGAFKTVFDLKQK